MIKIMAFFCLVQVLTMSNLSDEEAQFKLVYFIYKLLHEELN